MKKGSSLIELLLTIAVISTIFPALLTGFVAARNNRATTDQKSIALSYLSEAQEALRVIKANNLPTSGTYHPVLSGSTWVLSSGSELLDNTYTRTVLVEDVYRNSAGDIVVSGTMDPSTKLATTTVSWNTPFPNSVSAKSYLTRNDNLSNIQTTAADFNAGAKGNVQVTNNAGGEITLASSANKAKWCSPAFSGSAIDLPDGPPVAVSARSNSSSTSVPNDVFVATSPGDSNSIKLAYISVAANSDPPTPVLNGTFTLDPTKYSSPSYVPTGIGLDNNFKTNDVKFYTSGSGKLYALIATNKPDREVIAIQIKDGSTDIFQDPVNKIYKYWTYFNTRQYQGDTRSTPNQDYTPFGYGAVSLTVAGTTGYAASGGYLYVFDLSNIDSKSPSNSLDMKGCRIELNGYDCKPGTGIDRKYSAGQTGGTWSSTTSPAHIDCSDGGNIELYADNDIYPVQVGGNSYIYVAVGAGTNPEFNIANVTNVPSGSTSPSISSNSCGRVSGGNAGWKVTGSLDFNSVTNTEEASNSVFAKSDGTRAYVSSNGGIDADGNGQPDSEQFYVINTSNKTSPQFLSGSPATGAQSGYYQGSGANGQMYPRNSLTVLNDGRAVLVGKDGVSDSSNAWEYQVLNIENESAPAYCGGIDYNPGFNDITSVSEADGDNFVYAIGNSVNNELKIIEGGPDVGAYVASGVFESSAIDLGSPSAFNRYDATYTLAANTTIGFQFAGTEPSAGSCNTATYSFVGPDRTSLTKFSASSGAIPLDIDLSGYENPAQCFKYKVFLDGQNGINTPILEDMTLNYSP